jgi:DNA-binding PadR family transcriptional regulator
MPTRPVELSAAGWAVLGVVAQGPTHGFAVSQLLAAEGPIGRVWTLPRPVVYRELARLGDLGLIAESATVRSERGPARTIMAVTPAGTRAVRTWLSEPVEHVRDVRSLLLLKLVLLHRAGRDSRQLLMAQREQLAPQLAGLAERRDTVDGFERVLAQWRLASSQATLAFLDAAIEDAEHPE